MLQKDNNKVKNTFSDNVADIPKAFDWINKNREIIFNNKNNDLSIYSCAQGMSRSNLTGTIINTIKYVKAVQQGIIKDDKITNLLNIKAPNEIIYDMLLKKINSSSMELSFIHSVTSPNHHAAISSIVAGPNKKADDVIKQAIYDDEIYKGLNEKIKQTVDAYRNIQPIIKENISILYNNIANLDINVGDFNHKIFANDNVDKKVQNDVVDGMQKDPEKEAFNKLKEYKRKKSINETDIVLF
jgi:hypothetical protein